LGRGRFRNHTIFNPEFFLFMAKVPMGFKKKRLDHDEVHISGGQVWLNNPEDTGFARPYPEAPADLMVLRGHWGQFLIVVPSLKLVAVRTGDTRDGSFNLQGFVRELMNYVGPREVEKSSKAANLNPVVVKKKDLKGRTVFKENMVKIGLSFTAKSFCSCLFVTKLDEKACRDYAALKQVSPMLSVDYENKSVKSSLFFLFKRTAQFVSEDRGCLLN